MRYPLGGTIFPRRRGCGIPWGGRSTPTQGIDYPFGKRDTVLPLLGDAIPHPRRRDTINPYGRGCGASPGWGSNISSHWKIRSLVRHGGGSGAECQSTRAPTATLHATQEPCGMRKAIGTEWKTTLAPTTLQSCRSTLYARLARMQLPTGGGESTPPTEWRSCQQPGEPNPS